MEHVILFLQCVALYVLVTIASMLETNSKQPCNAKLRMAVHIVRDTDANHTLSVILQHTGTLVKCDSVVHNDLIQVSKRRTTQDLMSGRSLRQIDGTEIEFVRIVHDGVDRERMQQLLETHSCDIVPVGTDAPDPALILDDIHALLGVLLSKHNVIESNCFACAHTHPPTPMPSPQKSPRQTPRCRNKAKDGKA
ncbi:MAG: hypothetical protein CMM87_06895 [Rickettsiales bacterium]|nr:hypothetical protein [Rickettsiales bacterium]|tara:strand:+ start:3988 stop:4569 length:582 start_codon:yes stop_codon:yes gene_type:complete